MIIPDCVYGVFATNEGNTVHLAQRFWSEREAKKRLKAERARAERNGWLTTWEIRAYYVTTGYAVVDI